MAVVAAAHADELVGTYFSKSDLKDIPLRGFVHQRDVVLNEYASDGQIRGTFKLQMPERDPKGRRSGKLSGDVLTGQWTNNNGRGSLPVYLELKDILTGELQLANRYAQTGAPSEASLEGNAQSFYFAVLKANKADASRFVRYPLRLQVLGRSKTIRNKAEFIRNYPQIFSVKYLECLRTGAPHNMFVHNGAAMLGSGEVWFDGEGFVIALNPCMPH